MAKSKNIEMMVGVMMLIALGSFFMLALQVSGLKTVYDTQRTYRLSAEFTNIGSLKPRSKVSVSGVSVGRVTSINLDAQTYNAVVHMDIDEGFKLNNRSQANILTAGLLGDNYIGLVPGHASLNNEEVFLKEGDRIEVESTGSAMVLEELISKFMASSASNSK